MVVVVDVVVDGTITVPLTGLASIVVDEFDHIGTVPEIVLEAPSPVPVTRGIVVKLKEGIGVKTTGIVIFVEVWFPCPVSDGTELALVDGSGKVEDTVPLMTSQVVVEVKRIVDRV